MSYYNDNNTSRRRTGTNGSHPSFSAPTPYVKPDFIEASPSQKKDPQAQMPQEPIHPQPPMQANPQNQMPQNGQPYQGQRTPQNGQVYQGQMPPQNGQPYPGQRPPQNGQPYPGQMPPQNGQPYQGQMPPQNRKQLPLTPMTYPVPSDDDFLPDDWYPSSQEGEQWEEGRHATDSPQPTTKISKPKKVKQKPKRAKIHEGDFENPAQGGARNGKHKPPKKKPIVAIIIGILLLGILAAVLVHVVDSNNKYSEAEQLVAPYETAFMPNIFMDDIALGGMTYDQAKNAINDRITARENSWSLSLTANGHTFTTLNTQMMGATTDRAQVDVLLQQAYAIGKDGDVFQKKATYEYMMANPQHYSTPVDQMSTTKIDDILNQLATYFYTLPSDASLLGFNPDLPDPFVIQPAIEGQYLDIATVRTQILSNYSQGISGSLELVPIKIAPNITTESIKNQVTLRSTSITDVSEDSTKGRTENLRIASAKINGLILEPGETFSFNEIVGKRTRYAGFQEAPEYAYGELVVGIGGGVCQISTNVYIAAVTSEMDIVRRIEHSSPVNYTLLGQDATVADGRIDLLFKNTSPGKVYITAHVIPMPNKRNRWQCVVSMYGLSMGQGVQYRLRSETVREFPADPPVVYKDDEEEKYVKYTDQKKRTQKPVNGQEVDTYLQRYENGVMISEEFITKDEYKAKPEVYYVGIQPR